MTRAPHPASTIPRTRAIANKAAEAPKRIRHASALLTLLACTALSTPAFAQLAPVRAEPKILGEKPDRTFVTLEYIPATGDLQKAGGIGVYRVSEDSPGFYVQFITDLDQERPRFAGDPGNFPEPTVRRFREATLINAGVTGRLGSVVMLTAGIGLSSTTPVSEKDDPLRRVSRSGRYFVEDGFRRENRVNVQVGVLFNLNPAVVGVSYNSDLDAPQFSVGLSF